MLQISHEKFYSPIIDDSKDSVEEKNLAVAVRNLYKSYGKRKVLQGLDLSIESGTIFGLLGPSGCGKTSLLKCILGRLSIDCGDIKVLGESPRSENSRVPGDGVGYMPQDIALYDIFTVKENLLLNAKINRIPKNEAHQRVDFLLDLLDILDLKNQLVQNLSGGQKRRVSLAVALFHNPDLLLLDEPTVGVDPILRMKIWKYLLQLVREGKTIIITTHYIEEARQADCIGLLRNGKILAQGDPEELIDLHQSQNLEDLFLQLCQAQDSIKEDPLEMFHSKKKTSWKSIFSLDMAFRMYVVVALTWGNLIRTFRNIPLLVFQFLLPAVQISLFCLAIGGDPQGLTVYAVNEDYPGSIGDIFFEQLRHSSSLDIRMMDSFSASYRDVSVGKGWGIIQTYPNFSESLLERVHATPQAGNDEDIVNQSTIWLTLDMTNAQNFEYIYQSSIKAFELMVQQVSGDPDLHISPVGFKDPVFGSTDPSFTDFMAPGIILNIAFAQSIGLTAIGLVLQKRDGTLDRLWSAGISGGEVIISLVLTQLGILILQAILLLFFALVIFEIACKGSLFLVVLLVLLLGLGGIMYGVLISSLVNDERGAIQLSLGSFFPILLLSGVIWPVESIPAALRVVSYALPTTWGAEAMRSLFGRGWGITNHHVWAGFVACFIWTFVCFLLATRLLRSID